MESKPNKTCTICGAKLARRNVSGHCHPCAMNEVAKHVARQNADFRKILEAYRQPDPNAAARFRHFIDQTIWKRDTTLARNRGTQLIGELQQPLTESQVELYWRTHQYRVNLPAIALDIRHTMVRLWYFNDAGQDHRPVDMKRHFQAAISDWHPHMQVTWFPDSGPKPKPN